MKKIYALDAKVREEECDHSCGFTYRGKMPCTGPRVCHMCGTTKDPEPIMFVAYTTVRALPANLRGIVCEYHELGRAGRLSNGTYPCGDCDACGPRTAVA